MKRADGLRWGAGAAAWLALASCGGEPPRPTEVLHDQGPIAYVAKTAAEDELAPIRFADGQVSLNDRCIVRKGKLNLRMPPLYVNGRPIGFC
jgi:hypothetical protein